tara:strand:+ start:33 stop:704 length:672 start_codon:yes stop_codon:yes gene_type:complete
LQTCILVSTAAMRFTIDFGATSLVGLRQRNIDPNSIDAVLLTHLHGDHCAGIPFLLLDAVLGSRRERPLTIAGPRSTQRHLNDLQESLFPGSSGMKPAFALNFRELVHDACTTFDSLEVRAIAARHTPQAEPSALKVTSAGKTIAYTGDGEYTDALSEFVHGVDLLIAESYSYDKPIPGHLNYEDIDRLQAKRIVLTHMNAGMLARADTLAQVCAYDGLEIEI